MNLDGPRPHIHVHAAHRGPHHQTQVLDAEILGHQTVLRLYHVVVAVAWKPSVRSVAGLARLPVADPVGEDDPGSAWCRAALQLRTARRRTAAPGIDGRSLRCRGGRARRCRPRRARPGRAGSSVTTWSLSSGSGDSPERKRKLRITKSPSRGGGVCAAADAPLRTGAAPPPGTFRRPGSTPDLGLEPAPARPGAAESPGLQGRARERPS